MWVMHQLFTSANHGLMSDLLDVDNVQNEPEVSRYTIGPNWLPGALVVIASFLAVLGATSMWVWAQALDTDDWVQTSSDLLAEDEVTESLSTYLVDELYANVDVPSAVDDLLPEELSGASDQIAAALQSRVIDVVDRLLSSDQFAKLWETANREMHERFVAIVTNDTPPNVDISDGTVTIDLGGAVQSLSESLGLPGTVTDQIPDDAGQVTVFQSDELASVQSAVQVLDFMAWFLLLLVVLLYVLAVFLARGRRFAMLSMVGVGLVVAGVAVLLLQAIGVRVVVDNLVVNTSDQSVAIITGQVLTEMLRELAWTEIVYGALIAGFAALLGTHRWAVSVRNWVAPALRAPVGILIGEAALLFLLLWWWNPGDAFDHWITAVLLLALVIGALVTLTLQLRDEDIDEPLAVPTE